MNIKLLNNFNLSDQQAKIYLACLELGTDTVYNIAKRAGIARSSSYEILRSLEERKIVASSKNKKTTIYTPISPEELLKLTKQGLEQVELLLPELKLMFSSSDSRPKIRIYEGRKGLIKARQEELQAAKKTKKIAAFATMNSFELLSDGFPDFRDERTKAKIFARLIMASTPTAQKYKQQGKKYLMKVKLIPKEYDLTLSINICADKVFIFSLRKDIMSIVIESKEISSNFLKIFDFVWHSLN